MCCNTLCKFVHRSLRADKVPTPFTDMSTRIDVVGVGFGPAPGRCSACWGAPFSSGSCPPHFVPGKLHFKNKFCDSCRTCILVPLTHIRALSRKQAVCFVNKRTEGFWNIAPANMGGAAYRIVNNTAGCVGPWLALFREPPPDIHGSVMPEQWATDEGYLRLCVAKGTLVPAKSLRCGQPQASAKRRKVDPIIASKFHTDVGMLSATAAERTALPPLSAQELAAMLDDSDTDTDSADALVEVIEAVAAGAAEVLSPIQAQPVARASGSTVRAYPTQAVAAQAVGARSSFQSRMQGGPQDLQRGLQEELQDILEQEVKELEAWTLDASCGYEAASCNEANDEAVCDEAIDEAASYDFLWLQDNLGSCTSDTSANSDRVQPETEGSVFEAFEVLQSAHHHVNSTLHTMLGDERVSGVERELFCRHLPETRQLAELLGEGEPASRKRCLSPSTTPRQSFVAPKAQLGLYARKSGPALLREACEVALLLPPTLASKVTLHNHDSYLRGAAPSAPRIPRAGEALDRPKFEVNCLMGRDSAEIRTILAMRYAALHALVLGRPSLLVHNFPRSCTKRIMQQDSVDVRTVSSDAVALMEFATELFVGLLTALAWQVATQPAKRHTLNLSDVSAAVACSSSFDFLVNVIVAFGAEVNLPCEQINPKQRALVEARQQEKHQALGRLAGTLGEQGTRASHAKRRQRGLGGRFLGSANSNSNSPESLVGGPPMQPPPAAAAASLPPQPQLQQSMMPMLSAPPPATTTVSPTAVARQLTQQPPNMWVDATDSYLTAAAADPPPPPPTLPPLPLQPPPPTQPTPAAVVVSGVTGAHESPLPPIARRSVFDVTNVTRVMAHNLPAGVKISRDAKECMCQIASEMTGFVTMEASAIAKANVANETSRISKANVGLDECVWAFPHLGLEGFLPTIQHWVQATHAERMASRRRNRAHLLI